ncbi:unnamed protein product, partial [Prorocentrum cordatum]
MTGWRARGAHGVAAAAAEASEACDEDHMQTVDTWLNAGRPLSPEMRTMLRAALPRSRPAPPSECCAKCGQGIGWCPDAGACWGCTGLRAEASKVGVELFLADARTRDARVAEIVTMSAARSAVATICSGDTGWFQVELPPAGAAPSCLFSVCAGGGEWPIPRFKIAGQRWTLTRRGGRTLVVVFEGLEGGEVTGVMAEGDALGDMGIPDSVTPLDVPGLVRLARFAWALGLTDSQDHAWRWIVVVGRDSLGDGGGKLWPCEEKLRLRCYPLHAAVREFGAGVDDRLERGRAVYEQTPLVVSLDAWQSVARPGGASSEADAVKLGRLEGFDYFLVMRGIPYAGAEGLEGAALAGATRAHKWRYKRDLQVLLGPTAPGEDCSDVALWPGDMRTVADAPSGHASHRCRRAPGARFSDGVVTLHVGFTGAAGGEWHVRVAWCPHTEASTGMPLWQPRLDLPPPTTLSIAHSAGKYAFARARLIEELNYAGAYYQVTDRTTSSIAVAVGSPQLVTRLHDCMARIVWSAARARCIRVSPNVPGAGVRDSLEEAGSPAPSAHVGGGACPARGPRPQVREAVLENRTQMWHANDLLPTGGEKRVTCAPVGGCVELRAARAAARVRVLSGAVSGFVREFNLGPGGKCLRLAGITPDVFLQVAPAGRGGTGAALEIERRSVPHKTPAITAAGSGCSGEMSHMAEAYGPVDAVGLRMDGTQVGARTRAGEFAPASDPPCLPPREWDNEVEPEEEGVGYVGGGAPEPGGSVSSTSKGFCNILSYSEPTAPSAEALPRVQDSLGTRTEIPEADVKELEGVKADCQDRDAVRAWAAVSRSTRNGVVAELRRARDAWEARAKEEAMQHVRQYCAWPAASAPSQQRGMAGLHFRAPGRNDLILEGPKEDGETG